MLWSFSRKCHALTIASSALLHFCLCHNLWHLLLEGEWSFLIHFLVVMSNSPQMGQTLLTAWTVSFTSLSLTKPRTGHILDVQWMLVEYFIWLENGMWLEKSTYVISVAIMWNAVYSRAFWSCLNLLVNSNVAVGRHLFLFVCFFFSSENTVWEWLGVWDRRKAERKYISSSC